MTPHSECVTSSHQHTKIYHSFEHLLPLTCPFVVLQRRMNPMQCQCWRVYWRMCLSTLAFHSGTLATSLRCSQHCQLRRLGQHNLHCQMHAMTSTAWLLHLSLHDVKMPYARSSTSASDCHVMHEVYLSVGMYIHAQKGATAPNCWHLRFVA